MGIEFKPVKQKEIPRRGKYREEVRKWINDFLKLKEEKGIEAVASDPFDDKDLAMSYYDSFKDHIKKHKLPIDVKIRQKKLNPKGKMQWILFLVNKEA